MERWRITISGKRRAGSENWGGRLTKTIIVTRDAGSEIENWSAIVMFEGPMTLAAGSLTWPIQPESRNGVTIGAIARLCLGTLVVNCILLPRFLTMTIKTVPEWCELKIVCGRIPDVGVAGETLIETSSVGGTVRSIGI